MRLAILLVCWTCGSCLLAAPLGLEAVVHPSALVFPPDEQIRLVGTTAVEGEGLDYKLLAVGESASILTIAGPAVIHRVWSTSGLTDGTRLVLKLDGQEQVVWEKAKLPEGQSDDDPLRAMDGQAYWSYAPLKVEKAAEFIAHDLRKPEATAAREAEGNKFYLQVAYSEGGAGVSAELTQEARKRLNALIADPLAGTREPSHGDKPGTGEETELAMVTVSADAPLNIPGDEKTIIEAMVIDVGDATFEELLATRLVMKSDGAAEACVDAPLPCLFGAYWALDEYAGPVTAISGGKLIFRLPIPIGKGLEMGLAKFGAGSPSPLKSLQITFVKRQLRSASPYRFCAEYREMVSKRDEPLRLADIQGEGVFLGGTFAADGVHHRKFTFLEGNEQIYVDGAEKPTWEGTGSEDFFNGAWYFSAGVKARAFHGLPHLDEGPPPRMSAYRYLIPDRISFKTSLRYDMQHGSRNSSPDTLYKSVAFWYQKPPCKVAEPKETELPKDPFAALHGDEEEAERGLDLVTPTILTIIVLLAIVAGVKYFLRRGR